MSVYKGVFRVGSASKNRGGCWIMKGLICQTQESGLFPAGSGKALKGGKQGNKEIRRLKRIVLQIVWKMD